MSESDDNFIFASSPPRPCPTAVINTYGMNERRTELIGPGVAWTESLGGAVILAPTTPERVPGGQTGGTVRVDDALLDWDTGYLQHTETNMNIRGIELNIGLSIKYRNRGLSIKYRNTGYLCSYI